MRMKKHTINVFLDTEVFEKHHYDFSCKSFQQLIALKEVGAIRVYSTEITRREIEVHLKERSIEAFHQLKRFKKDLAVYNLDVAPLRGITAEATVEEFTAKLFAQFQDFWSKLAVKELSHVPETLKRVMDRYFEVSAPFGSAEKKAEFPDAIAADAILSWCQENDEKMHIVTADKDWERICADNTRVFRHNDRLPVLLALFPEPEVARDISDSIRSQEYTMIAALGLELMSSVADAAEQEFSFETIKILSARFGDIFILDADDGDATAQVDILFDWEAEVRRKGTSWVQEYGHNKFVHIDEMAPYRKLRCTGSNKATAELYLSYQKDYPSDIEIEHMDTVIFTSDVDPRKFRLSEDDRQPPPPSGSSNLGTTRTSSPEIALGRVSRSPSSESK